MERRVERVVWYKKPMLMPVLVLVIVCGLAYFAYEMFKGGHADDNYSSSVAEPESPAAAKPAVSTPAATPAISSTSGSNNQVTSPTGNSTVEAAADAPTTESQPAQPVEGRHYSASGHLELYRQGNVTYQFDTDTGASCVIYASLREWRNPIVYRHACR